MGIFESAIFWIVVAAASEIIALTPLKSNSVIQLVLSALNSVKPKKGWAISRQTGSGYGDSIPVALRKKFVAIYKLKSSMPLFRIR